MTVIATALKHMLAAGMDHDAIVAAVADMEASTPKDAQAERKRAADRERMRDKRLRAKSRDTGDKCDNPGLSSPEVSPQTPFPKPLQSIPPSPPKGGSSPAEFAEFWDLYPNKTGKAAALPKFAKARKRASFETIMAGLRTYVAKTDDRPWCNPTTWLHQERWADEPPHAARGSPPPSKAPSQAEVFAFIARNSPDDPGLEHDDSRSARQAIPHLSAVGSER